MTFFALGIAGGLMLNSVTPSATSFGTSAGSPAASLQTPVGMPAPSAARQVISMSRKTAGWSERNSFSNLSLPRSTARMYWVRSFVPIEKKSASRASSSAHSAAAGVSTITPTSTGPGALALQILAALRKHTSTLHKQELGAEEPHALGPPGEGVRSLRRGTKVRGDLDPSPPSRFGLHAPVRLQRRPPRVGFFPLLLEEGDLVGVGVHDDVALVAVHGDDACPERLFERLGAYTDDRRCAHRAGHDGDVGGFGALGRHQSEYHVSGHPGRLGGGEVAGQDDRGDREAREARRAASHEPGRDLARHVPDVVGAGGHVLVLHPGEEAGELLTDG